MFGLGFYELLFILIIALVVFGPGRLPQIGSGLGKAIRDFKKGVGGEEPAASTEGEETSKEDKSKELPH